jgi:hypothetical protein
LGSSCPALGSIAGWNVREGALQPPLMSKCDIRMIQSGNLRSPFLPTPIRLRSAPCPRPATASSASATVPPPPPPPPRPGSPCNGATHRTDDQRRRRLLRRKCPDREATSETPSERIHGRTVFRNAALKTGYSNYVNASSTFTQAKSRVRL